MKIKVGNEMIEVKNNQIGILRSFLSEIFKEFEKSDKTKALFDTLEKEGPKAAFNAVGNPKLNFEYGDALDYTDEWYCQWYMFRYAMAYSFEYYIMYMLALKQLDPNDSADAFSFGCGAGVDFFSFLHAAQKLDFKNAINWRGTDIAEWAYKMAPDELIYCGANDGNMVNFLDHGEDYSPNILFFPKMLSEVPPGNIIDEFCGKLKRLNRDKIVVCISYRSPNSYGDDTDRKMKIVNALLNNGYEKVDLKVDEILNRAELSGKLRVPRPEKGEFTLRGRFGKEVVLPGSVEDAFMFNDNPLYKDPLYKDIDPDFAIPYEIWRKVAFGIKPYCPYAEKIDMFYKCKCPDSNLEKNCCPNNLICRTRNMCFQIYAFQKKK